jgi:hypothetical protein
VSSHRRNASFAFRSGGIGAIREVSATQSIGCIVAESPSRHFTTSVKEIGANCSILLDPAAVAVGVTVNVFVPAGVTTGATGGGAGLCWTVLGVPPTLPHPGMHRKITPTRHAFSSRTRDPFAATPIMQSASIAIAPQRAATSAHLSSTRNKVPAIVPEEFALEDVAAAEDAPDVVTLTIKFTAAPFVTVTELRALQLAPVGAPVHENSTSP